MTPERIAELRTLVARHKAAIGPGGEKAWLDGQLARVVPELLDELERLRTDLGVDLPPEQWQSHADKVGREYEFSAPAVGSFIGWLAYRHETERANVRIVRAAAERANAEVDRLQAAVVDAHPRESSGERL